MTDEIADGILFPVATGSGAIVPALADGIPRSGPASGADLADGIQPEPARFGDGREWSVSRIRRAYAAEVAGKTREPIPRRPRKRRQKPNLAALWLHRLVRALR
jgi:hypothetical protein